MANVIMAVGSGGWQSPPRGSRRALGCRLGRCGPAPSPAPGPNRPPTIAVMGVSIRDAHLVIFTETGSLVGNVSVMA